MSDRIIKKYADFMSGGRWSKSLNQLFIEGVIKRKLFQKSQKFEIVIYFTPIKKKIVDIGFKGVGIGDNRLGIDFKIGDSIDLAKEWVSKNGHQIVHEIDRL